MIKLIFRQLWNQRKLNTWIFLEIVVAGVFLWYTVDTAFVTTAVNLIPNGYDEEGMYQIELDGYRPNHKLFDKEVAGEEFRVEALQQMMDQIRNLSEVESFYLAHKNFYPNSLSWSGSQFFPDTLSITEQKYQHAQWYEVYDGRGSDFLRTMGLKDAYTGELLSMAKGEQVPNRCYISEDFAKSLFGPVPPVNKKVYEARQTMYTVKGVFGRVKTIAFNLPYALIVRCTQQMPINSPVFVIRLKKGVDGVRFAERFMKEVAPTMKGANLYVSNVNSMASLRVEYGKITNEYNRQRLQYSLISFTLLCIFLGMVGTISIRTNARRQEIGLMRSLGASTQTIVKQFFCESWLLVTAGFILSLIGVVNLLVVGNGMTQPQGGYEASANASYWMFEEIPHFMAVTLLTYVLLLAISWIGTYIPVHRAVKVLPADALRDE